MVACDTMCAAVPRRTGRAIIGFLALMAVGCHGDRRFKPTFRVTGRVLFEGQPPAGATVALVPANPNEALDPWVRPRGVVDAAGSFAITTYTPGDGVPDGDYALLVYWLPTEAPSAGTVNRLPDRYATIEGSPARVTVESKPVDVGIITLAR